MMQKVLSEMFSGSRCAGLALCALLLCGCGGGGSSSSDTLGGGASTRACGAATYLPNYVAEHDPNTGLLNVLHHWPHFPLKLAFGTRVTFRHGTGQVLTQSDPLVTKAIDRWVTATSGGISYVLTDSINGADIVVNFAHVDKPTSGGELGLASVSFDGDAITGAIITLNYWDAMTEDDVLKGLVGTATHEFGHALGIQGHSASIADAMYVSHTSGEDQPVTRRDADTLYTAYCGTFSRAAAVRNSRNSPTTTIQMR